jgi:uncharacterized membrane protein YczE
MNQTRLSIFKSAMMASLGLILFASGIYLTIQADIGVAPWDAFCLGLAKTVGIKYGTASIIISLTIVGIDLLLKEKIGIGTILDAFIVGKTVDLLNWLDLIPKATNIWVSILMLIIGFFIMGFSQYLYMKTGLSCGPRDSFQVGIGRRLKRVPIGVVNIIILAVVLVIGWILGGPIGIGTLIAPVGIGLMQQLSFNMMRFEPKNVVHQSLPESINVIYRERIRAQ